ncbi:MAG: ParA family protein [Saccharospirillum sp.]|nr:ParA family protein [Saccharospirillum sp.]
MTAMIPEDNHNRARVITAAQPLRILIANAKGGSGKTTVATNLSSYFANRNETAVLIDYDPQGSSTQWLQSRQADRVTIHGVAAYRKATTQFTRSWYLRNIPADTRKVIIDTPSGLSGNLLNELVRESDVIIIPVTPSPIDIRATTVFIKDLLLSPAHRASPKRVAVIANRVRKNTLVYAKLELFLRSLKIPFIATLRDTQFYVRASEYGLGLHDLDNAQNNDLSDWRRLIEWIDQD